MKQKVNIMCLYWVGDFRGRDFCVEDVWRLHQTINKHIDREFDFYVLTNSNETDLPGETIELKNPDKWPGWWSKMDLHRPDLPQGRTLYMDLDNHVIRSLQPILDTPGPLVMFPSKAKPKKNAEAGWVYRYQAATMLFDPGAMERQHDFFSYFERNDRMIMAHYRSEQDLMGQMLPDLPMFPDKWLMKAGELEKSKKYRNHPPDDVIIITGQTKRGFFRNTDRVKWLEKMARQ